MTSTLKTEKIQFRGDNSDAMTLSNNGGVTLGGTGGLHVGHSNNNAQVATFINSSYSNSSSGVVHVKQTGATNQPTMVIEQTGTGGNPSDTQGLHIKIAGQNQGSGQAIRITTENSSLNSGNAYDAFSVTNGGGLTIKNTSNATTLNLTTDGSYTLPKQPGFIAVRSSTRMSSNNGFSNNTYHTVAFDENGVGNFDTRNNYDASTERFTFPTAGKYLIGFNLLVYGTGGGYIDFNLMYNSTLIGRAYYDTGTGGNWKPVNLAQVVNASVNDYVWIRSYWTGNQQVHEGVYGNFWGYLLG
ncbi:MAG: hypothetical protein CMC59_07660 [Flavobacteriaceae bacterium]|nr:hypothetical protein [Flavobacteriaceae bacterium]